MVIVVVGPPGSGKSSYVRDRARWGDLIVDLDAIYQALSGLPIYEKPESLLPFVCEARDAIISRLERASDVTRAWILTSAPDVATRQRLRQRLRAQVVVIETSANECIRRISQDDRRSKKWKLWQSLVERWWRDYERDDNDTIVR